jgi:regulator of extracellular matrix RemA (YlzA/DUF370 family)
MFVNVGYRSFINAYSIKGIVDYNTSPVKRAVTNAQGEGKVIDATYGRKTMSVVYLDNGYLVLSALKTGTIAKRGGIINCVQQEEYGL